MEKTSIQGTSTLRDYVRVLFRQKAVVVTSFFSVMIIVYIGLQLKTPVYESSVKMLMTGVKGKSVEEGLTRAEIVKSIPVLELAVEVLDYQNAAVDYE